MSSKWEQIGQTVCRVYSSGAVRDVVPYLEFKIENRSGGYDASFRFTPESCLVNQEWREKVYSYSDEYTLGEVTKLVEAQMLRVVKHTFNYLDE